MTYRLIGLGLLVGLLGLGCGGEEKEAKGPTDPLAGNWLLMMSKDFPQEGFHDVTTVMLSIQKNDGKYTASLKGSKPALPGAKLKSYEIKNDRVHLVLVSGEYALDFVGKPQGKTIPGNVDYGRLNIEPARLVRSSASDIDQAPPFAMPDARAEFEKFLSKISEENAGSASPDNRFSDFQKFCDEHPQSPISVLVYHKLAEALPQKAASEADVKKFADGYLKASAHWGSRMVVLANYNLSENLGTKPKFAGVSLEFLKKAEDQLAPADRTRLQALFDGVRRYVDQMQAREQAKAIRATVAKGNGEDGLETLRKLHEKFPFDPVLMFYHAEAARATDHVDEALRSYARISTWPSVEQKLTQEDAWLTGDRELPRNRLLELWVKQHGSEAGLDDFKQKVYAEATTLIAEQIGHPKTPPAGNRVSVMELFTGAQCPPCVGADLATAALEHLYPKSHLIVLRYHVHIPAFDPMTNGENFGRFAALLGPEAQDQMGTPTLFLNGARPPVSVAGYINQATRIGKELNDSVRPAMDDHTPLDLKLSAYQNGGEITVSAKLDGVPENQSNKLRVLLLLAEGDVKFPAPNGILRHEMLVRWLYNGEKGSVLNTPAGFDFTTTTRVTDIREFLKNYLKKDADEKQQIPLALEGLYLVGFVHNAETREILQAASVPVEVVERTDGPPPVSTKPGPGPTLLPPSSAPNPAKAEKPAPPIDREKGQ